MMKMMMAPQLLQHAVAGGGQNWRADDQKRIQPKGDPMMHLT